MTSRLPPRTSRLLLALACCLALLAPAGAAARTAAGGAAAAPALAGTPADLGQALLQDRVVGLLAAPGGKRDDRQRPSPALPGALATALAAAPLLASARRVDRPARRRGAATAGARAPPPLRPTPV
ncbi:MAG TPA: hypothetical protein VHO93_01175 [Actinomycetota bacterium]|jgi:hypothetical protein|nr:hypothetical protein [Actinomycetota bacterium]